MGFRRSTSGYAGGANKQNGKNWGQEPWYGEVLRIEGNDPVFRTSRFGGEFWTRPKLTLFLRPLSYNPKSGKEERPVFLTPKGFERSAWAQITYAALEQGLGAEEQAELADIVRGTFDEIIDEAALKEDDKEHAVREGRSMAEVAEALLPLLVGRVVKVHRIEFHPYGFTDQQTGEPVGERDVDVVDELAPPGFVPPVRGPGPRAQRPWERGANAQATQAAPRATPRPAFARRPPAAAAHPAPVAARAPTAPVASRASPFRRTGTAPAPRAPEEDPEPVDAPQPAPLPNNRNGGPAKATPSASSDQGIEELVFEQVLEGPVRKHELLLRVSEKSGRRKIDVDLAIRRLVEARQVVQEGEMLKSA